MKVLFDYQGFQMQKFGGVSNSYAQIIESAKLLGLDFTIGMRDTCNVHLIEQNLVKRQSFVKYICCGFAKYAHLNYGQSIYNRIRSIELLRQGDFDVFEPTFFDPYFLPYLKGKPFVTIIHDMTIERYADMHLADYQIQHKREVCQRATKLRCPSLYTKQDMVEILGINPNKIDVIYHGAPNRVVVDDSIRQKYNFPYLLYVGDRKSPYKNFIRFVHEYAKIVKDYKDVHLVCTGSHFTDEEYKLFSDLHVEHMVHQTFVNERKLAGLYKYALAFVYPSLYEGFGMPILEAFTYGCPVLLTSYSCFPEVAGNAGLYFEMNDDKCDFYEHFKEFYELSTQDKQNLISKGYDRLSKFSWDNSAQQLLNLYKAVCS